MTTENTNNVIIVRLCDEDRDLLKKIIEEIEDAVEELGLHIQQGPLNPVEVTVVK